MTEDSERDAPTPPDAAPVAIFPNGARIDWAKARAGFEIGLSQAELSRRYGVSRAAVQKHIEAEGWQRAPDCEPQIARLAGEKLARVTEPDPEKRAEAIDAEAARRAAVVQRHREEWASHKALIDGAIELQNFQAARLAKITSETLAIRQTGERKAWGVDQPMPAVQVTLSERPGQLATIEEIRLAIDTADGRV